MKMPLSVPVEGWETSPIRPDPYIHGRERDLYAESDRFRDLPPAEQRIAAMWRDGEDLVDRQGRPRVPLGNGLYSQRLQAWQEIRRSRAKPVSDVITEQDFIRMYKAVATANMQGLILNSFLTVSWEVGGVRQPDRIASLHSRFLASMRTWANDRQKAKPDHPIPMPVIWVKEVGQRLGLHSHFLLNVPEYWNVTFRIWVAKAVRKLLELPAPDPRQPPAKLRPSHISWFGNDARQQWNVFRYMMKALDDEGTIMIEHTHREFLLREVSGVQSSPQGRVTGRRVGNTKNIGPATLRRLENVIGTADIWGDRDQRLGLRYDESFLRHGELGEQLLNLRI